MRRVNYVFRFLVAKRYVGGISAAKGYKQPIKHYVLEKHNLSSLPHVSKPFVVLGIETSCDDTCVGIVRSDGTILANVVKSQMSLHAAYGGVVPSLARSAHQAAISGVVEEALHQAQLSMDQIDGIAVTRGPGLALCLRVGSRAARELASRYSKPFVTVHHLEAHCSVASLTSNSVTSTVTSPYLCLLASGGHTSLLLVREEGNYEILGGTIDDAIGEAFDKSARLLGIASGGAGIEKAASAVTSSSYTLPIPLAYRTSCDFSFSGLKNSFRLLVDEIRAKYALPSVEQEENNAEKTCLPSQEVSSLAFAFQSAAIIHIEQKILLALKYMDTICTSNTNRELVIVGGVAANKHLRERLSSVIQEHSAKSGVQWNISVPPPVLCTDNGVMIAWSGIQKFNSGISDGVQEPEQDVIARWPLGPHIGIQVESVLRKIRDEEKTARKLKYST